MTAPMTREELPDLTPEQLSITNDMIHAWIEEPERYRIAFRNDCKRLIATVLRGAAQASGWQPIATAPKYIQEYAAMRSRNIPRGEVVQFAGSMEDGSIFLFGHDALTHEVRKWIVVPQLLAPPPNQGASK